MKRYFYYLDISRISRIGFRNDINGLRAIAVLAVVFYHADFEIFKGGWLGVDIFFVISGYLISNIIISQLNDNTFTFKNFYLRRAKRILPALFTTLLLTIPFAYILLTPKATFEYIKSFIASLFFYANYYFQNLDFYIAESTKLMPLIHTWSLSIEEQFYLIFPLFVFFIFKYFKKYFTLIIGFFIFASIYLNTIYNESSKFYRLEFRIWELLLGALVMILSSNIKIKRLEIIGFGLMLFPLFYFNDEWINDIEPKLIALFGVSLIIFSNSENSYLSKLLNFKPLAVIGASSFSIYLLHQPTFAFYRIYKLSSWENYLNKSTNLSGIEINFLILITLIFGYLSFANIETKVPELIIKDNLKLFFVLFIFVLSSIFILNLNSKNNNLEYVSNLDSNTFQLDGVSCHNRSIDNICKINNNSNTNVLALGDSSLRSISYWLAKKSVPYEYNFESITGSACLFMFEAKVIENACPKLNKEVLNKYISEVSNTYIVVSARLPLYISGNRFNNSFVTELGDYKPNSIDIEKELKNTIKRLLDQNNKIIFVYPIPEQGWNVPQLFNFIEFNIGDPIFYPSNVWEERKQDAYILLDSIKSDNIFRVYPDEIFCDSFIYEQCVGAYKGEIFYSDDDHLSIYGGKYVADQIINVIFEK